MSVCMRERNNSVCLRVYECVWERERWEKDIYIYIERESYCTIFGFLSSEIFNYFIPLLLWRVVSFFLSRLYVSALYMLYQVIDLVGRGSTNGPGVLCSIPGHVIPKTLKMVHDTALLNTQQYKGQLSRLKWSNLREEVEPSPTPRCSSYWKRSLLVALDFGRHLYLYMLVKE